MASLLLHLRSGTSICFVFFYIVGRHYQRAKDRASHEQEEVRQADAVQAQRSEPEAREASLEQQEQNAKKFQRLLIQ